jgi:hypothetical protein
LKYESVTAETRNALIEIAILWTLTRETFKAESAVSVQRVVGFYEALSFKGLIDLTV